MSNDPTPEDFQNALDAHWHGRPPASLEDVMALYGVLAVAESGGALYTTPSKLEPFIDDGRIVTISVDLTGESPEIVDLDQDVLREETVSKLGYSHKSSGRGAKYSLTQIGSKNGNDAEGVSTTILRRIRSWTGQDSVQSLTGDDGHPDGWIIEALANMFEKDSENLESLQTKILDRLPEDESYPYVVTVRLRLTPAGIESGEASEKEWLYPAEIGVLEEAMKRYATANAANKNIDKGSSEGQGIGVVSGTDGRVVGTPESPLGVFSVKHPDAQPGLRQTESWRNYPVSDDVAMLFAKGQDLIDRCVYRNGGMETYALPYFAGEMTAEKAEALYLAIDSVDSESEIGGTQDPPMAQVTFNLTEHDDPAIQKLAEEELRFYTVTMPISDDKNIIAEEPAASVYWPTKIAEALRETIEGPTLTPSKGGFSSFDNWPLLQLDTSDKMLARRLAYTLVTNHEFTDSVFGYRDEEDDDFRRIVDHRLLSGTPINAQTLFKEYMRRYDDAAEGGDIPPQQVVAQQLVHLETLSRAGLLSGLDTQIEPTETTMTTETTIDTDDIATIREQRLDSFLDRPMFNDTTRKATALAGVLVGQISWHQDSVRNVGRPLDTGTKGDQLTKNGLENALTAALEKAKVYAQDSDRSYHRDLLYPETVDRLLVETEAMPTEWDIDRRELQFCYVLGHAHGRRSMPVAYDMHDGEDAENDETATA
ncbi:CRISPR-associated protein Cas8b/Csh1, subtype I-B/HMARI [Halovenus aranensis]|uniref:CRISPR-associated protein Cas8b/Csh1, subtype I-B/HMARI n=1 Tax=Halovenus aranensis TaxID=890420 RepID=A0A1G8STT6_9EURY|nr:type I-B CRISPR-associated protein Cas8b/Csh1 [Halovenus aranensis]SDJ32639.1 CRISPR-associated protein Cas8b/Csh1, subtype I-B/HMARI [Halovenus aranensis]